MENKSINVSSIERDQLLAVFDSWKNKLVNFDGRNRQIYYRSLKTGDVNFSDPYLDQFVLDKLLNGDEIRLSELYSRIFAAQESNEIIFDLPDETDDVPLEKQWLKRLKRFETIYKKSKENFEERNISTCYLADGFISWNQGKKGAIPNAPLFFNQIEIKPIARGNADFSLRKVGDAFFNDTLKIHLKKDFGVSDEILSFSDDFLFNEDSLIELTEKIRSFLPAFAYSPVKVLGNFSFHKLPMYKDMERIIASGTTHEFLAAFAGSLDARAQINSKGHEKDLEHLSNMDSSLEHLIFPADSSQHNAISAVMGGKSIVIQGPPGSGKSQTIANLIAESVIAKKKILFVAEKRAAIDAVVERLAEKKLDGIVLDLHGEPDKRSVAKNLLSAIKSLDLPPNLDNRDQANLNFAKRKLQDRWNWMNKDSGLISKVGLTLTYRELYAELGLYRASLDPQTLNQALFLSKSFENQKELDFDAFLNSLSKLTSMGFFSDEYKNEEVLREFDRFVDEPAIAKFLDDLRTISELFQNVYWKKTTLVADRLLANFSNDFNGLYELLKVLEKCEIFESIYGQTPVAHVISLKECLLPLSEYKRLKNHIHLKAIYTRWKDLRELRSLNTSNQELQNSVLLELINRVSEAYLRLDKSEQAFRELLSNSLEMRKFIVDAISLSRRINSILSQLNKKSLFNFVEYEKLINLYLPHQKIILNLPIINKELLNISKQNLVRVLDTISELNLDLNAAKDFCNFIRLNKAMLDAQLPLSSNQSLDLHEAVSNFKKLDTKHLRGNAKRILSSISSQFLSLPSEDRSLLNRESLKKSHHLPFRKLFELIPSGVLTLKPVIAMSPLAVSQLMPCNEKMFDIVIFDEASQIRPEEAVTSIYRAKQVVIAGDRFQLPPTSFGEANIDEDYESLNADFANDASQGMESILTTATSVFDPNSHVKPLRLHYRSNDERLILWSNFHIYKEAGESLFTFPSTKTDSRESLRYSYLEKVRTQSMDEPNYSEIEKVKEIVLRHIEAHPDMSLGIISFGLKHASRLENEFLRLEKTNIDFYLWKTSFAETREKFFVKNIERVQGDERDAIVISPGYAPNLDGNVPLQFGTLNRQGGERRLNVAASRAKEYVHLVTSLRSSDIDLKRTKSESIRLFRSYLEFFENEGKLFTENSDRFGTESPFESEILQALTAHGLQVECQVGESGFRIDFAIKDPVTNKFVLAVEADGATYHSSEYARERDYMRQTILEKRGWKFVRIWSSDWWQNPDHEIQRVLSALSANQALPDDVKPETEPSESKNLRITSDQVQDRESERKALLANLIQHNPNLGKSEIFELWLLAIGRTRTSAQIEVEFSGLWCELKS